MSIVLQYENTTIQNGDAFGNIAHQGVLASNVVGTQVLTPTFPTTSTGTSLGHYHYTESGTNALKFLNVAGSGSGGHKFYTSNSTTAPVNTATIGLDGLTIDTGIPGGVVLTNLPSIIVGQLTQIVFSFPPSLDTFGIQFGVYDNPVQVLFNSGPFVTGVIYYAQATNAQTLKIRLTTNPLDPEMDCSSFTFGQVPFAYVTSNTPATTQVINLFENLTITDDTDTSALTTTALTFNNINVKMNQVTPTLIYSSPVIYADGHEPATSLTIRNTYGYNGWYYKNSPPNTAPTNKINWYFPAQTPTNTLVSDLMGITISFFNGITTGNDDTLYLVIYTVPTGSGDIIPGFAHSARTFIFNQSIQPTQNTNYQGVCIIDKSLVPFYYETQVQYQIGSTLGSFLPTDKILTVVVSTNSSSVTNSVEFVVNKLNLHYVDFTQSFLLIPP